VISGESGAFVLLGGPAVGEELVEILGRVRTDGGEDVAKIAEGIEAQSFAGDGDGVDRRGSTATFVTATEEIVLATDHDILDRSLGCIVVDGEAAGFQVAMERGPVRSRVRDGLADGTLRQSRARVLVEPSIDLFQDRRGLFLTASLQHPVGMFGRQFRLDNSALLNLFFRLAFDVIELADQRHHLMRAGGIGRLGLKELSPRMRPASHLNDFADLEHRVVAAEGIRLQISSIPIEPRFRSFATSRRREVEERVGMIGIAEIRPKSAGSGLGQLAILDRHGCVIGVNDFRLKNQLPHPHGDRFDQVRHARHPVTHRLSANLHTVTSENSFLAIERRVSGAGELHPRALPEPDVSVSTHPAPIIPSPYGTNPSRQCANKPGCERAIRRSH
jgi:hypothetical protein